LPIDPAALIAEIPKVSDERVVALAEFLRNKNICVLSGAGVSTESGIPDYRGPSAPLPRREPMRFASFRDSKKARKRYWARALLGFSTIRDAKATSAHHALSSLESHKIVRALITQNVDGLHQKAGSQEVVELHGSLHYVRCLRCNVRVKRREHDERLREKNPHHEAHNFSFAPDGDADLNESAISSFEVVDCGKCGGILKPDVVFFGENVPKAILEKAYALFDRSDALLIVGTSLHVYSGRRFLHRALKQNMPSAIVNHGGVREEEKANLVVAGAVGDVLSRLAQVMGAA